MAPATDPKSNIQDVLKQYDAVRVDTTFRRDVYNALMNYVKDHPHLSKEQDAIRLFVASILKKEGYLVSV